MVENYKALANAIIMQAVKDLHPGDHSILLFAVLRSAVRPRRPDAVKEDYREDGRG